eukprot:3769798-Pyramimonas_sp.AAC.2
MRLSTALVYVGLLAGVATVVEGGRGFPEGPIMGHVETETPLEHEESVARGVNLLQHLYEDVYQPAKVCI